MARRNPVIGLIGLGLAVVLLVAADVPQALRTASAGIFLIREGEVVEEDLYVAGSTVKIAGTIKGDLIVLATDHLEVSGRVEGDVIGFATTANIGGMVGGSVRLAGVDFGITAEVDGDVVGLGRDLRLGGSIAGDTLVWSRSLFAGGRVGHDMGGRTFGSTTIAGEVGRDVEMTVGRMRVLDGARITEDLGYRSANGATIHPGAVIGGTAVHRLPLSPDLRLRAAVMMVGFIAFVLFLAYGLLRIRFRPGPVDRSVAQLEKRPLRSFLRGLVPMSLVAVMVLIPVAGMLWGSPMEAIVMGVSGLVVIPLLLGLLVYLFWVSSIPVLVAAGRRLSRGRLSSEGAFVLAAVLMAFVLFIPYVRIIAGLGIAALGAGANTRDRLSVRSYKACRSAAGSDLSSVTSDSSGDS